MKLLNEGVPWYKCKFVSELARRLNLDKLREGQFVTFRDGTVYQKQKDGSLRRVGKEKRA
jgi:hypothetical protein